MAEKLPYLMKVSLFHERWWFGTVLLRPQGLHEAFPTGLCGLDDFKAREKLMVVEVMIVFDRVADVEDRRFR